MKLKLIENEPLHFKIEEDKWKLSILTKLDLLKELISKNPGGSGGSGEIHFPEKFQEFLENLDGWTDYVEQEFQKSTQRDEEQSNGFALKILELENKFQSTIDAATKKILDKPVSTEVDFTEIIDSITDAKKELEENLSTLDAGEGKKIASLQTSVDELKTQSAAHDVKVDSVIESLNELDTKTNEIKTSISNIKIDEGIGEKLTAIDSKIDSVQTSVDGINNTEVVSLINDLGEKVGEVKASVSNIKIDDGLGTQLTSIEGKVDQITESVSNDDKSLLRNTYEIVNKHSYNLDRIKETVDANYNRINATKEVVDNIKTGVDALQTVPESIADMSTKVENSSTTVTSMKEKIDSIDSTFTEMASDVATLKNTGTGINSSIGTINNTIDGLKNNIATTLSDLAKAKGIEYNYNHEPKTVYTLETEYSQIIEEYPELAFLTAVGFTAVLKSGNILRLFDNEAYFINGKREYDDYRFHNNVVEKEVNGEVETVEIEGTEIVNVWYFGNPLQLFDTPDYNVVKTILHEGNTQFSKNANSSNSFINEKYFLFSQDLVTENLSSMNFFNESVRCTTLYHKNPINNLPLLIGSSTIEAVIETEKFDTNKTNTTSFINTYARTLEKLTFSKLIEVNITTSSHPYTSVINTQSSIDNLVVDFQALQTVTSQKTTSAWGALQRAGLYKIILPSTLISTTGALVVNSVEVLEMYSRTASFSDDAFAYFAGDMIICEDWLASMNLTTPSKNWSMKQIENILNKLGDARDFEGGRYLTFDSTKLTAMKANEEVNALIEEAQAKGWTIGGA